HTAYDALIDLADFGLRHQAVDQSQRALDRLAVRTRNVHGTVVFDIDGAACLLDDALDGLAARANDDANLVRLHLDGRDARCEAGDPGASFREHFQHFAENVQATFTRLIQRALQHAALQAFDLDVHLDGGDPVLGAADFEVHVSQVVLVS